MRGEIDMTGKLFFVTLFSSVFPFSLAAENAKPVSPGADSRIRIERGVKWIDGTLIPIEGRAYADVEHYYDRLPADVTTNVNAAVRRMKHHTAGMQFRFSTDSANLRFRWVPYFKRLCMDHMPATGVSGIDIYRRTDDGRWLYVKTGRITDAVKGGELAIPWEKGDACIVNLPLYNGVRSFTLGIDEGASIRPLPPRKSGVVKPVVFYGTSVTHGGCCSRPGMAFPSIMGRRIDVPIVNLGFSGSALGELEMSDHMAAIDASCYVVDCIWNMSRKMMISRYEKFIRNLRAKRPGVPIVMAEACDVYCGENPRKNGNDIARKTYGILAKEGFEKLHYLPSSCQMGDDYEGTVDGSHPNDWGMMHMADAFGAAVKKAVGLD